MYNAGTSRVKNNNTPQMTLNYVARIENYAFYESDISKVSIPASVTTIGKHAFKLCTALTEATVAGAATLLEGAKEAREAYDNADLNNNLCYRYAVTRDYMYRNKRSVEMYVTYEPQMSQISEWLKQLFGESEGKEKKGLLPGSVTFSTDLHSLGQFVQDGTPLLFETIINVLNPQENICVPHDDEDLDGLNYLEGKDLGFVNQKAFEGTLAAHHDDGNVPCAVFYIDELNAKTLGYLFYFFMRACAMSAYMLEINPFNQPGVEVYKKNMFHLLGKKGY